EVLGRLGGDEAPGLRLLRILDRPSGSPAVVVAVLLLEIAGLPLHFELRGKRDGGGIAHGGSSGPEEEQPPCARNPQAGRGAAVTRNCAAAGTKPIGFDVNLFAFTDDSIAAKMLALAAAHPNLTIKIATDWSSLAESGGRKVPFLEHAAAGDYAAACAVDGGD